MKPVHDTLKAMLDLSYQPTPVDVIVASGRPGPEVLACLIRNRDLLVLGLKTGRIQSLRDQFVPKGLYSQFLEDVPMVFSRSASGGVLFRRDNNTLLAVDPMHLSTREEVTQGRTRLVHLDSYDRFRPALIANGFKDVAEIDLTGQDGVKVWEENVDVDE